jgi:DNA-binding CsgD family transcriptional regulator
MALYLDRHDLSGGDLDGATREQVLETHRCDLSVQGKYGVQYLTYWWRYLSNTAFCLVEAPSKDAAEAVHREAHGLIATNIIEVDWQSLETFLGTVVMPAEDELREDVAFRVMLCVSVEERLGPGQDLIEQEVESRGARTVHRGNDELLACFAVPEAALRCALAIYKSYVPVASFYDGRDVSLRIGVSGGEPVLTHQGLFGDAIEEARSLCNAAEPGAVLVSSAVRELCEERGFIWSASVSGHRLVGVEDSTAGPKPSAADDPSSGLSRREVDVLRLVAAGNTNDEVAERLCISRNTVATHVRHILDKTSSANRAEASTFAVRKGLI